MKLDYINKLPCEVAVNDYIEQKVWKCSDKTSDARPASIADYLFGKMKAFVEAYSLEQQTAVHQLFIGKIEQIKAAPLPRGVELTCSVWEQRITERLKNCFADASFVDEKIASKTHIVSWKNHKGGEVTAEWTVSLTPAGAPLVYIESLEASEGEKGKGRATLFLKSMVEELQQVKHPHARIELRAWTGYSSFMGLSSHGAFTWGRLGFQVKELTKKERGSYNIKYIDKMKQYMQDYLNDRKQLSAYFHCSDPLQPGKEPSLIDQIISETRTKIQGSQTPWEIANITVNGYHTGRYLLSYCVGACYDGVLYPNLPQSPGMIQYAKRVEELKQKGYVLSE